MYCGKWFVVKAVHHETPKLEHHLVIKCFGGGELDVTMVIRHWTAS